MKKTFIYSILLLFLCIAGVQAQAKTGNLLTLEDSGNEIKIFNSRLSALVINKSSWKLQLYGPDKKIRTSDVVAPSFKINKAWVSVERIIQAEKRKDDSIKLDIILSNGEKGNVMITAAGESGFKLLIEYGNPGVVAIKGVFSLSDIEEIYGFGEMWNGHVAQRGRSFDLWDKSGTPDECAYMPYFVSTNNYGFFLNYGGRVSFDVGQTNASKLVFEAPVATYEFTLLTGSSVANTVQNFSRITGMPARPPRWAYEPWFWLMSDPDQPAADINTLTGEHSLQMVQRLKELNYPVGVTWFEPPWQDARTSFIPNREFSPDIKKLIQEIEKLGVKSLAWSVPYTTNEASNWKEAVEKGYLVRKPEGKQMDENFIITSTGELEGNFYTAIDYFNPEAAAWWQKQIEHSVELGLKGYKADAGQDIPEDAILHGGLLGKDIHNSYALEYNKVYYNALKNKLGDDFLLIPRAAWIGSAPYLNFKWPGDLTTDYANNGLPSSVYSSLSLALSGIPFVSTDIGGFENRPAPEEVWIRWAQFGAFLPGMQTLNMPWWYSEKAQDHFRYLCWLHNDLIPFWESLGFEAQQSATPIIRPLVWDYQSDMKCWRVDDQFTVANAFLVAPVINANLNRDIYLPEGKWFDFWDEDIIITGPRKMRWSKDRSEGIYKFPLYIREGSIIPMEISNNISGFGTEWSKGYTTLAIWPASDKESGFKLQDEKEVVWIKVNNPVKNKINITWDKTGKKYLLRVHLTENQLPETVAWNTKTNLPNKYNSIDSFRKDDKEGWYFDTATKNLWIRTLKNEYGGTLAITLKQ
ncbi:MAG: hypothetical protein LUG18_09530 [Candidatus Azobacteroides sp.]|nr:hypothetical protein [Candidatus Azobacteroides sp.]